MEAAEKGNDTRGGHWRFWHEVCAMRMFKSDINGMNSVLLKVIRGPLGRHDALIRWFLCPLSPQTSKFHGRDSTLQSNLDGYTYSFLLEA